MIGDSAHAERLPSRYPRRPRSCRCPAGDESRNRGQRRPGHHNGRRRERGEVFTKVVMQGLEEERFHWKGAPDERASNGTRLTSIQRRGVADACPRVVDAGRSQSARNPETPGAGTAAR
jgi:hypothetical protein